ncbi:MAG: glycosyltransferase family 4 protein [Acidimicrobiales bacterium]
MEPTSTDSVPTDSVPTDSVPTNDLSARRDDEGWSASTKLGDMAADAGLARIHMLAWRDLDDPEAGGSEIHAATIARIWAEAGIDVTMRSSRAEGHAAEVMRDGYRVIRKAGRYGVFPRTAASGLVGRTGRRDGLVEIWNGMPFFSPVWARCLRVVFLHHVHAEMWRMALPPRLARLGELVENTLAPPFYRNSRIVTLSESSRTEIVDMLGLPGANIDVVPPGIEERFSPGGHRSSKPLVLAVGRLVPVKRFDVLIDVLARLKTSHPDLEAVIVGEGYERSVLEARLAHHGAGGWLKLAGRVGDDDLVDLYRQAWVVASASVREGWGMTITEAGACATPSVATNIAGHRDAIDDQVSGILARHEAELEEGLDAVLSNAALRHRLGQGALRRSLSYTWTATAMGTLSALASQAERHR